uniref:Predicted protein n=1 Tax=Hordeum vulgare subsp. vulgare TaxID=112509 RepID=F2DMC8_HORVV|nr:predicted protein [Hordeum vulgare subsp. vulgare]BAJ97109.1 predicted protein [Hordeum vulgare subsp. vulgare]
MEKEPTCHWPTKTKFLTRISLSLAQGQISLCIRVSVAWIISTSTVLHNQGL